MIRRPPRSTHTQSSAASDVYKRQDGDNESDGDNDNNNDDKDNDNESQVDNGDNDDNDVDDDASVVDVEMYASMFETTMEMVEASGAIKGTSS